MNEPTIPDGEEAALAVEPIRGTIWEALEYGISMATAHFGAGAWVDASLGSHLVRYHAKQFLMSRGVLCESVPLNGVAFKYGGYYLRVLKSDDGVLPVPGASQRKQNFYCQAQLTLFPIEQGEAELDPEINLVVLWDVTAGAFSNLKLDLACPKAGGETRASVEAHWYRPFPHPAMDATGGGEPEDGGDLDIGDLPGEGTGNDGDK